MQQGRKVERAVGLPLTAQTERCKFMYAFYMCSCCMRITGEGIWNGAVRLGRASFYAISLPMPPMPPMPLCHYEYLPKASTFFLSYLLPNLLHAYSDGPFLPLPPIGLHGSSPSVAATQRRSAPKPLTRPLLRAAATASSSRFMSLHKGISQPAAER